MTKMNVSDERLAEMVGAGVPCVPIMPGEVAQVVQELRQRRALSQPSGKVSDEQVTLADCPIGLFHCNGELCLKTEYGNNEGRIDAYIVSSGEFFWGGTSTPADQRKVMVRPVAAQLPARPVVKALEWKIASGRHEHSHSIFGDHFAYDDGSWTSPENHHMRSNGSLESAKKEAQADYERRILSTLGGQSNEA